MKPTITILTATSAFLLLNLSLASPLYAKPENLPTTTQKATPAQNQKENQATNSNQNPLELKPGKALENQGVINQNTLKVEVKNQGESTKVKTTTKWGSEMETQLDSDSETGQGNSPEQEVVNVDSDTPQSKFRIKVQTQAQTATIVQTKFAAKTHYPLTVNSETNELTVTTPAGTKVVAILPDVAIENMLRRGVVDIIVNPPQTDGSDTPDNNSTPSATPTASTPSGDLDLSPSPASYTEPSDDNPVLLTVANDQLVYKVRGAKTKRFLGLIPVNIDKTVTVSAENGEVVGEQINSTADKILNAMSF